MSLKMQYPSLCAGAPAESPPASNLAADLSASEVITGNDDFMGC
jgi:hypothetical protein